MGFHHTHTQDVVPCHVDNLYSNPNQPCFYRSDLSSPIFSFYIPFYLDPWFTLILRSSDFPQTKFDQFRAFYVLWKYARSPGFGHKCMSIVWENNFRQKNGTWYHASTHLMDQVVWNDDDSISLRAWSMSEKQATTQSLQQITLDSKMMTTQLADMSTREPDDEWDERDKYLPEIQVDLSEIKTDLPEIQLVYLQDVCSFVSCWMLGFVQDVVWEIRGIILFSFFPQGTSTTSMDYQSCYSNMTDTWTVFGNMGRPYSVKDACDVPVWDVAGDCVAGDIKVSCKINFVGTTLNHSGPFEVV